MGTIDPEDTGYGSQGLKDLAEKWLCPKKWIGCPNKGVYLRRTRV